MSQNIHPTAIVSPGARLGADVEIGPNAIIEDFVTIGDRCKIGPMVHIQGTTEMGPDNVVFTGATLGFPPQYLGFKGEPTRLVIGARNVIREYVSIHRGLDMEHETRVGDDCFFMGSSHIAHDCHIGNGAILANGALLGGHVSVGDRAFISGNAAAHQFVRIGRLVMAGGLSRLTQDVPPFTMTTGFQACVHGLNLVGLKRAGVGAAVRSELKRLLHQIYRRDMTRTEALAAIDIVGLSPEGRELVDFFKTTKRGVIPLGRGGNAPEAD